jgi:ABC-type sugar transport system permease subunit
MTTRLPGWLNQNNSTPYLFVAPFFILFLSFWVYPVFYSLYLSIQRATGLGPMQFVGLDNYVRLIGDPRFLKSLANTSVFAFGSVLLQVPIGLALALAFNSTLTHRLRGFYRVAYFLPIITPGVVVGIMFSVIYEFDYGLLNQLVRSVGLDPIPWIRSPDYAMGSILLLGIWIWTGLKALYLLAGLQSIPKDYYESAVIDGASPSQQFLRITLPQLRPILMFVIIQTVIGSYALFDQVWVLTEGGPRDATLTMTMYLYEVGFQQFRLGYSAAIGYSIVFIVLGLTLVLLTAFKGLKE